MVEPDLALSHAANFLRMLNGEKPSATATKTYDLAHILHAEPLNWIPPPSPPA